MCYNMVKNFIVNHELTLLFLHGNHEKKKKKKKKKNLALSRATRLPKYI